MYGLKFTKADNPVIRQMVIVLFDKHDYLQGSMTIKEAVTGYNLALNDTVFVHRDLRHTRWSHCKYFIPNF